MRIVLSFRKLTYVLDQKIFVLLTHPSIDQRAVFEKWIDNDNRVKYHMLASMSNDLQCQHEDIKIVKDLLTHLQELYSD